MSALLTQVIQGIADSLPASPVVTGTDPLGVLIDYLAWIVPIVVSAYASQLADAWMRVNAWLDRRSPALKTILVGTLSFLGVKLTQLVGVPVTDLGAFIAAFLPYVFKLGKQTKESTKAARQAVRAAEYTAGHTIPVDGG